MQRSASMAALLFSSLTCPNAQAARDATHLLPAGKGWGKAVPTEPAPHAINSPKAPATNGIYYHAGPILPGTAKLYFIWYGNFVRGWEGSFMVREVDSAFAYRVVCVRSS